MLALAVEDDGPHAAGGDDGPPTRRDDGAGNGEVGHGLIGMRERAAVVGGWVSAGPHDGGFLVLAELPLPIGTAA